MTKHHYNGCIVYYVSQTGGKIFHNSADEFSSDAMLIAEDICGLWLGLCRYADIGIGLAPLVCPYL